MGIFDDDNSEEEVEISPAEKGSETGLKDEVESKVASGKRSGSRAEENTRGKQIKTQSRRSVSNNGEVSLEDIHSQNKKIIGLLKDIAGEDQEDDDKGDLNGVL
jgi:hypothetical protein